MEEIELIPVQRVFDAAIHLIDEQSEANGITLTADTNEYRFRTLSIINILDEWLYPFSATYDSSLPGRPVQKLLDQADHSKPDFNQLVPLDQGLAMGVLPIGLAYYLMLTENDELAAALKRLFDEARVGLSQKLASRWEPITTPYGLF